MHTPIKPAKIYDEVRHKGSKSKASLEQTEKDFLMKLTFGFMRVKILEH